MAKVPCTSTTWRILYRAASSAVGRAPERVVSWHMADEDDRPSWSSGHRSVPHTADVRVEAWAPSRERCIAEAVAAVVETFLETSGSTRATGAHVCRLSADSDDDLLVAVLDEVVYLLETAGEVPIDVEIQPLEHAVDVRFATTDVRLLSQVGAAPKGVSLEEVSLASGPYGWSCSATVDV